MDDIVRKVSIDLSNPARDVRVQLKDGVRVIEKISVVGIFRDCAGWLDWFFKVCAATEAMYDVEFEYFLFESNSKDDTRAKLEQWYEANDKAGRLLLYHLKKDYVRMTHNMNYDRTNTLALLRNKLLKNIRPLDSDWVLWVDADIYWDPEEIGKFFTIDPTENNIVQMCAYTHQLFPPNVIDKDIKIDRPNQLVSCQHMYDTYALYMDDGRSYYPNCPYEKCAYCAKYELGINRRKIPDEESTQIVDVRSCFGGLAFVKADAFNDSRVTFDTLSYDPRTTLSLSEWVLWCDRLRTVTGKRIVQCQFIDRCYRTR